MAKVKMQTVKAIAIVDRANGKLCQVGEKPTYAIYSEGSKFEKEILKQYKCKAVKVKIIMPAGKKPIKIKAKII